MTFNSLFISIMDCFTHFKSKLPSDSDTALGALCQPEVMSCLMGSGHKYNVFNI